MDQIAVILNEKSEAASLEEKVNVALFERDETGWSVVKEIPSEIDFAKGVSSARQDLSQLIGLLGACRIIVGKSVTGIVYRLFDAAEYAIFEVEAFSAGMLDDILTDRTESELEQKLRGEAADPTRPAETSLSGIYRMDLILLQKEHPEISSKKALQPFLNETPFLQLDIVCSHVPPWLEAYVTERGCGIKTSNSAEGKIEVTVIKKYC